MMTEKLDSAKTYLEYLPEVFHDLLEIKILAGVIDLDMTNYYSQLRQFVDNQFIFTSDLETIKRWEEIFNLTSPIKDDLQSRRQAVRAKMMSQPPINLETLQRITEAYLGVEVVIEPHLEPYVIRITYKGLEQLPDLQPYFNSIYNIIPANVKLIMEYAFQTWKSVKAKIYRDIAIHTWHEVHYDL